MTMDAPSIARGAGRPVKRGRMTADDFARIMPDVAKKVWGEPARQYCREGELRWGTNGARSVEVEKGTWFDFEANEGGGVLDLIKREKGGDPIEWLKQEGFIPKDTGKRTSLQATYDYTDETGALLFQVCRLDPKDFRQRRKATQDDPPSKVTDGWFWGVKGVRQVPYRLPELLEAVAQERPVFIVEGEKDADALTRLGLAATCNAGGARKWRREFAERFVDADAVVIPDNDSTGREHAQQVVRGLSAVAKRVRILDLAKCWPECPEKGDISDWIAAGGTAERLLELIEEAPAEEKREEVKDSAATEIVKIAQRLYDFKVSDAGETFGVPRSGPKVVHILRGGKTSLRSQLSRE